MSRLARVLPVVLTLGLVGFGQNFAKISANTAGITPPLADSDLFGQSIAHVGDVNGDGFPDIAVGAHFDDSGALTNSGAVHILFLNANGGVQSSQKIAEGVGGFSGQLGASDNFGAGIAAVGDLDNNGVVDLAVGAWFDDDGGSNRGAVYILFLTNLGTVQSFQKISATVGGFTGSLDNDDNFGNDVAAIGDLDADGVPDIAVGASRDDDGGANLGAVYVLFLNSNGTVKAHQKISATSGGLAIPISGTRFGLGLTATLDINMDGRNELVVGSPLDIEGGASRGAAFVLFLDSAGVVAQAQKISSTQGGFTGSLDASDQFGNQLAGATDQNADGIPDLLVGAPGDDDGGADRGALYTLHLSPTGLVTGHTKISSTSGLPGLTLDDGDGFGRSVAWIGASCFTFAAGAPFDDDGGTDRGAVYGQVGVVGGPTVPCDYPTIQAAINALPTGSTITVGPGVYAEHSLDFGGKNLVLTSLEGPYQTIIDAQNLGRVFRFQGGESSASIVTGFTLRNGQAPNGTFGGHGQHGGGILIAGSSPQIRRCILDGNRAGDGGATIANGTTGGGGGAVNVTGGNPSFQFCIFTDNSAGDGGNGGAPPLFGPGRLGGAGGSGGALRVESGAVTLVRCTLASNRGGDGGMGGTGYSFTSAQPGQTGGAGGNAGVGAVALVGGTLEIFGCIVWANNPGTPGSGGAGGTGGPGFGSGPPGPSGSSAPGGIQGSPSIQESNIQGVVGAVDPQFEDLPNKNLHLLASSPLINTVNAFVQATKPGGSGSDIDGEPSFLGSNADIGADERTVQPNLLLTPSAGLLGSPLQVSVTGQGFSIVRRIYVDSIEVPFTTHLIGFLQFIIPPRMVPGTATISIEYGLYNPEIFIISGGVNFPFELQSVSPSSGSVLGGTLLTMSGPGIGAASTLRIDGLTTSFTVLTNNSIRATSPQAGPGIVDIAVEFGPTTSLLAGAYNYEFNLTGVAPSLGPVVGGTVVTLTGPGIGDATSVSFGALPAASFSALNSSTIEAVTPAHAGGSVTVSVHFGTYTSSLVGGYTFREPIVLNVPGNYATASAAIAAALSGDTVQFGPGVHYVATPINPVGKNLTFRGAGSTLPTVLDGNFATGILDLVSGESLDSKFINLVFRHGARIGGGAVRILNSSATFQSCKFIRNTSYNSNPGGAVRVDNGYPVFEDCEFLENQAQGEGSIVNGGAVYLNNALGSPSSITKFSGCGFIDNRCSLLSIIVFGVSGKGGALFSVGNVAIEGCIFRGNVAGSVSGVSNPNGTPFGHGGAIRAEGNFLVTVVNSLFVLNRAGSHLGSFSGVATPGQGGAISTDANADIKFCTFYGNEPGATPIGPSNGTGGVHNSSVLQAVSIRDSILWSNSGTQVGGLAAVTHSVIMNGYAGVGNSFANPLFVDAQAEDFRLTSGSPCRDTGTPGVAMLPATDLAGSPRFMGLAVDMGAYEHESLVPVYSGTGDDLTLVSLVNGIGPLAQRQKVAMGGDTMYFLMSSPQGSLIGTPYLMVGDGFPTGSPPPSLFPGLHVNPFTFFVLRDGFTPLPGGLVPGLSWTGNGLYLQVPPGISGISLLVQGAVLTPLATNGIVAITDGHEIQIYPSP